MASCQSNSGVGVVNGDHGRQVVCYGSYAQDVVSDATIIAKLDAENWTEDTITLNGTKYARLVAAPYSANATFANGEKIVSGQTYYFTVTDIEWYVLTEKDGSSVLFAKDILDVSVFNTETEMSDDAIYPNNWAFSTIRTWLNETFVGRAFNAIELASVNVTRVVSVYPEAFYNRHNSATPDTWDKVYCLSYAETVNGEYGFTENGENYDCLRMAEPTDYARAKGAKYYASTATPGSTNYERDVEWNYNGEYWLRTCGSDIAYAATVRYTGQTGPYYQFVNNQAYNTTDSNSGAIGVRPAVTVGFTF
jgi:hypothetical protein